MMSFCWHIHHDVLVEPTLEPIKNRIAYIKAHKPKEEQPTRLRLLRAVRGRLPKELRAAGAAYDKARAAAYKARAAYAKARAACVLARWAACGEARAAYDKVLSTHRDEIEALHAKECPDCPWDGQTIFPNQRD